jgi:hypothetical protein
MDVETGILASCRSQIVRHGVQKIFSVSPCPGDLVLILVVARGFTAGASASVVTVTGSL